MTELLAPRLMTLQKESMKEKNKLKTATLRSISASFKQILVDDVKKESLTKTEEITVLKKMIKQRVDSAEQFKTAGREDLEEKELAEIEIIAEFIPKQLSPEEVEKEVNAVLETFDSPTMQNMGEIMGKLSHLKASADMGMISGLVRKVLVPNKNS